MSTRVPVYANDLVDLRWVQAKASSAAPGTLKGKNGIRVEDGMLLVPNLEISRGAVEVEIVGTGPCYAGIAFRFQDALNFELAYAAPHSSGMWDAIQYDPVFHGSNTWQAFHGTAFQRKSVVPTGDWFTFRVEFDGDRAWASVDDQAPLVVSHLARPVGSGGIGLWTYQPAYFRDLRVYEAPLSEPPAPEEDSPAPKNSIKEWFAEGYGVVTAEPHGILLLNRFFPVALHEVCLSRRFTLERDCEVRMAFGFSDDLSLAIDRETVFAGNHTFRPTPDRAGRGYIQHGASKFSRKLAAGEHLVEAKVRTSEPFGWGLAFTIEAQGLELMPAAAL